MTSSYTWLVYQLIKIIQRQSNTTSGQQRGTELTNQKIIPLGRMNALSNSNTKSPQVLTKQSKKAPNTGDPTLSHSQEV